MLERSRGVSDTTDMRGLLAALGQDGSALLQRPVLAAKDAEEQEITRGKSDVTEMFGLAEVPAALRLSFHAAVDGHQRARTRTTHHYAVTP